MTGHDRPLVLSILGMMVDSANEKSVSERRKCRRRSGVSRRRNFLSKSRINSPIEYRPTHHDLVQVDEVLLF